MTVHREQGAKSRGQGLAEFALILPLVLFTIFVMIELARLLHAWISVENGARFGVRYAVTGEYDFAYCTSLYGGPCDTQAKRDGARLPSIRDATNSGSVGLLKNSLAVRRYAGLLQDHDLFQQAGSGLLPVGRQHQHPRRLPTTGGRRRPG